LNTLTPIVYEYKKAAPIKERLTIAVPSLF